MLPYFWGAAVISNVYVVVCGSTLARVYFKHEDSMATSVKNAMTCRSTLWNKGVIFISGTASCRCD